MMNVLADNNEKKSSETVTCIICGSPMHFFLSKPFHLDGLEKADYWRCNECRFVISKTHAEMTPATWKKLNYQVHASYQGTEHPPDDDPNWITRLNHQAQMLHDVEQIGLLQPDGRWLDYACGDGRLSAILQERYHRNLLKYEAYMQSREDYLRDSDLVPASFDLVITTSVFEHFFRRSHFDTVESLLSAQGVLATHTLVCESVPDDPTWFYMNPVHCAFHTNRSMEILFRQWGYTCSIYNVEARLWLWFKSDADNVEKRIQEANSRTGSPFYLFKRGFVDYWKCVPVCRL